MILSAVMKTIIKSKWILPVIIASIIGSLVVLFLSLRAPEVKSESYDVVDTQHQIENEIDAFYTEVEGDELSSADIEGTPYISAEETIQYLFTIANIGDVQLFPTVFMADVYEKDFFHFELSEREAKVQEAMNRLSRNGKLKQVKIIRDIWVIEKDATRVVVDIYYEDLPEPIRINVLLKKIEQAPANQTGSGLEQEVFFVNASIWDLLKDLENN